jgi:hypothetical protein
MIQPSNQQRTGANIMTTQPNYREQSGSGTKHTPGPWFSMKCLGQPIWTVGRYVDGSTRVRGLQMLLAKGGKRDAEYLSEQAAERAIERLSSTQEAA